MKLVKIRITGTSPVSLSCDKLADPLDPETIAHKKLTSIRGKSKSFINEELLSDDASKKMDSGIAKISALAAFSKTRLKG